MNLEQQEERCDHDEQCPHMPKQPLFDDETIGPKDGAKPRKVL